MDEPCVVQRGQTLEDLAHHGWHDGLLRDAHVGGQLAEEVRPPHVVRERPGALVAPQLCRNIILGNSVLSNGPSVGSSKHPDMLVWSEYMIMRLLHKADRHNQDFVRSPVITC